MAAEFALVDSGATENFLNHDTAKQLEITLKELPTPQIMNNIDRSLNQSGLVKHYYNFCLKMGEREVIQQFYIGGIGTDHFILGFPWLQEFNPPINWTKQKIEGPHLTISTTNRMLENEVAKQLKIEAAIWGNTLKHNRSLEEGDELVMRVQATHFAQEWAIKAHDQSKEPSLANLPEEYRWHWKVFSEEQAKWFPPSRGEDNHAIHLKPDAPDTLQCKIYPFSPPEAKFMHEWMEEQLAKGYIEQSKSPYTASTFCIKKKNGSYRLVQDYRPVNYWTIQDQYPLPDIKHITKELQEHTLFTKFDIRSGYNNVRIHEGDEWKATFCTAEGHWQPKVIYFGQCNAPPTFQRIINKLLQPLKNKYPGMIHVYMDDILISTPHNLILHRRIIHDVLDVLEATSFYLQVAKCVFEATHIEYLGLLIDRNMLKIDPTKLKGIQEWPKTLKTLKQV